MRLIHFLVFAQAALVQVAGCATDTVKSNFSGATLVVDFDPALAIDHLHVTGMLADGTAPFKPSDFAVKVAAMPPATVETPIAIVLSDQLDGQKISFEITGLKADGGLVATGTAGTTLAKGFLIALRVRIRPPATCGNGIIEPGETCDDGNTTSGDGCSDRCALEPGYACISEPSVCVPSAGAIYVDAGAACPGDGTQVHPFCRIGDAALLARAEAVLVKAGVYREQLHLFTQRLGLYGEKGAVLESDRSPALLVDGRASLTARDLVIRGSDSGGGGIVVRERGSSLFLSRSQVGPSNTIGLKVEIDAQLRLERTRVADNTGGGLWIDSSAPHRIVNDIIASNGSATSSVGGVFIAPGGAGTKLVNDTIADNTVRTSSSGKLAPGVRCLAAAAVINTIVWDNRGGPPIDVSLCRASYSDLGPLFSDPGGPGSNFEADPKLSTDDHISADSPCRDRGDPSGVEPAGIAPADDFSGNARPRGSGVDVGADEVG